MTQASNSVITRERSEKGKTYQEYLESGINNRDRFEQNYDGLSILPEQLAQLNELSANPGGPHHMVVIGEDWCPDVYRGIPVAQRIAEGLNIPLKIFERDQNKDMIAEYLKDGEFESIPVLIFYNRDHEELAHFIERPKLANEQLPSLRSTFGDMTPEGIAKRLGHEPSEEELAEARTEYMARYSEFQQGEVWAEWRVATVDEVIGLLQAAI